MRKRAVRTTAYLLVCVLSSMVLTGCEIVPSLNITEEQSTLIAEYAAGKLIEYAKGHPGGLMILEDVDRSEVNPGLKKEEPEPTGPAPLPGADAMVPPPVGDVPPAEGDVPAPDSDGSDALVDAPEGSTALPTMSIAEAFGIPGADIQYDHYEVCSHYPENGEELAFSMKAATGKELLVTHFKISNPGAEEITAHTDSTDLKVRLMLNGTDKLRVDVTFLENDLMNYDGLISTGESEDAVLVFEIPEGTQVSTLDLIVVKDDGDQTYNIL